MNIATLKKLFSLIILTTGMVTANAQICNNPSTFIYGLTASGMIHRINVTSGSVGTALTPAYTGNAPSYSNALGYNNVNGKFYYFKRNSVLAPQEFVSFDPATNTVVILASSPAGTTTIINLGCVTADGLGYYCIDAYGKLFYYHIATNTWTTVTTQLYDQFGTNLIPIFNARIYGDIAIDGTGSLWILPASATQYGLYKLTGPLPTTPVASITVQKIVDPTTATPNGATIGGIAFTNTGVFYVSTNTPDNKLFRLNANFSWTLLGTMTVDGIGNDLTSCNFPISILPVSWEDFGVELKNRQDAEITWTISAQVNNKGFYVEHSLDGSNWKSIAFIEARNGNGAQKYSYLQTDLLSGKNYYRIKQVDHDGKFNYSSIKTLEIKAGINVKMGPNPTLDVLNIQLSSNSESFTGQVFDLSGQNVLQMKLHPGQNAVSLNALGSGNYIVRILDKTGNNPYTQKITKR